jgi:hypothetical protein
MQIFKFCMSFDILQFAKLLPSCPWCRYHELRSPWDPSPDLACAGRHGKCSRVPVASRWLDYSRARDTRKPEHSTGLAYRAYNL